MVTVQEKLMPYQSNPTPEEDPYSDGAPGAPEPQGKEDEQGEGNTALLPKSICPGMKPGEELVLKIDAVHENEYQVSYAPKEEKETEPEQAPPPSGDSEMASMME